jgi:hypothetical protein
MFKVSDVLAYRTWWSLFQKRVVFTNFDLYVFSLREDVQGHKTSWTRHIYCGDLP